jgi:hypothetical protein
MNVDSVGLSPHTIGLVSNMMRPDNAGDRIEYLNC